MIVSDTRLVNKQLPSIMVHQIENFFGVYLLYCKNPRYKGRTYIGFTVDPNRRIDQHNKGTHAGGAKKTSGRGPWDMVLIVHGFPNMIAGLRFEWAWQHPDDSRRLKNIIPNKKRLQKPFDYKITILGYMLRTGPWNRLPLTIRWLKQEYHLDFDPQILPPAHMPIAYGPVKIRKANKNNKHSTSSSQTEVDENVDDLPLLTFIIKCGVCHQKAEVDTLKCFHSGCKMVAHTMCLAKHFLKREPSSLLPVEGSCPNCHNMVLWGDLIRYKMGCYQTTEEVEDNYWADST